MNSFCPLSGDALTFGAIAETLTMVTGRPVTASFLSVPAIDALLGRRSWASTQRWYDTLGYPARPHHAAAHGLTLATFEQWAEQHREDLVAAVSAGG